VIALVGGAALAQGQGSTPLKQASWLAPKGQLEALSQEPDINDASVFASIEAHDSDPAQLLGHGDWRSRYKVGKGLFRTPFLFGGQAAKAALSCNSCHVNGAGNPHFQFPSVSGAPGTADITHSFFSKSLGNGEFDPKPIPDLTQQSTVDHDLESEHLERFIETIVTAEFSGDLPNDFAIQALATYVRALQIFGQAGELGAQAPLIDKSVARDLDEVAEMVDMAVQTIPTDRKVGRLLLAGARHRLFLIYERIIAEDHDEHRDWLENASLALALAQQDLAKIGDNKPTRPTSAKASERLNTWLMHFEQRPDFAQIERQTLYNPDLLKTTISKRP
jgi:hypothetical protein